VLLTNEKVNNTG